LRAQVGGLTAQVQADQQTITCLKTVPVTSYFGYDYNGIANATTALDFTTSGDPVDAWMVALQPGTCGRGTFASVGSENSARTASPFGPLQLDLGTSRRSP